PTALVADPQPSTPLTGNSLLARQLFNTALLQIEPLFDPLSSPPDVVLRANSWFLPWLRANLLFFYEHQDLSVNEAARLLCHPFKRLLQVVANYHLGSDWSVIEKLDERFLKQATEVAESLLDSLLDFVEFGSAISPIHHLLGAALTSIRTEHPWLVPRAKPSSFTQVSRSSGPPASEQSIASPSPSASAASPAPTQQPTLVTSSATGKPSNRARSARRA
ncbi:MAG: hypothetical protein ACOVNV_05195, partial [Pirellulaceae bacterium]